MWIKIKTLALTKSPRIMLNKKDETYLLEFINNAYGSKEEMAKILDLGIEMLFYVEEDAFSRREIQGVVSAIRDVIANLRHKE
ncbi:hypothetical protein [Flagellimonas onchidii]|uniref:hypothetical protein n=1 Tax=Flagellimonas onchidii TaxID=2562684 RepID=UPI0010A63325|nr:hypothetical protein [Allomuricauda onchidii]